MHVVVSTCMQTRLTAWSPPQFSRASAATAVVPLIGQLVLPIFPHSVSARTHSKDYLTKCIATIRFTLAIRSCICQNNYIAGKGGGSSGAIAQPHFKDAPLNRI